MDLSDLAAESNSDIPVNNTNYNPVSFNIKSDFYPIDSKDKDMDFYQNLEERDVSPLARNIPNNVTGNLSAEERTSLNSVHKDPTIVIKNADKGGAVVVMNATSYREEAL